MFDINLNLFNDFLLSDKQIGTIQKCLNTECFDDIKSNHSVFCDNNEILAFELNNDIVIIKKNIKNVLLLNESKKRITSCSIDKNKCLTALTGHYQNFKYPIITTNQGLYFYKFCEKIHIGNIVDFQNIECDVVFNVEHEAKYENDKILISGKRSFVVDSIPKNLKDFFFEKQIECENLYNLKDDYIATFTNITGQAQWTLSFNLSSNEIVFVEYKDSNNNVIYFDNENTRFNSLLDCLIEHHKEMLEYETLNFGI